VPHALTAGFQRALFASSLSLSRSCCTRVVPAT
jgi:hypothetical protein